MKTLHLSTIGIASWLCAAINPALAAPPLECGTIAARWNVPKGSPHADVSTILSPWWPSVRFLEVGQGSTTHFGDGSSKSCATDSPLTGPICRPSSTPIATGAL